MDSVSVQGNIINVEPYTSQVLFGHDSLLSRPLEASNHGVLDLVEVLDSLGAVHEDVGAGALGAEAPDLTGLGDIVLILVGQVARASLEVIAGVHFTLDEQCRLVGSFIELRLT